MQDQPKTSRDSDVVDEVIERRPWWRVCLIIFVIFAAAVAVVAVVFIRYYSGSGPKRVSALPENFPSEIVLFRPEQIADICHYSAASKNKPFRLALVPLRLLGGLSEQAAALPDVIERGTSYLRDTDTVSVGWTNVDATADEVLRFYAGAFKQAGVTEPQMRQTKERDVSEMIGSTDKLNMNLMVVDRPETKQVDSISLFVEYPGLAE